MNGGSISPASAPTSTILRQTLRRASQSPNDVSHDEICKNSGNLGLDLLVWCLGKKWKKHPKWWFNMVIYHVTIRKKTQSKKTNCGAVVFSSKMVDHTTVWGSCASNNWNTARYFMSCFHPPKIKQQDPKKLMLPIGVSFSNGLFSGAMFVVRGVSPKSWYEG